MKPSQNPLPNTMLPAQGHSPHRLQTDVWGPEIALSGPDTAMLGSGHAVAHTVSACMPCDVS